VKFLQDPTNIERLKDGLKHTYTPSEEEALTAKRQIDKLRRLEKVAWMAFVQFTDPLLTWAIKDFLYPSLHGDTGAGILEVIAQACAEEKVPIKFDLSFANNGLSCDWAYVIDLDAKVLEVFKGAQKKTPGHRFGDVGEVGDTVPSFISSLTFSELQSMESEQEFLDQVNRDQHEESVAVRAFYSNMHKRYAYRSTQGNLQAGKKRTRRSASLDPEQAEGNASRPSKHMKASYPPTTPNMSLDDVLECSFSDICLFRSITDRNCHICRMGFEKVKATLYSFVEEGFKDKLQKILDQDNEIRGEEWSDQFLKGNRATGDYDPRKTHSLCLEDKWDDTIWGYLQAYIKDAEDLATKLYKQLKLTDRVKEDEELWLPRETGHRTQTEAAK